MKETAIQGAILEYLAARHVLAFRMNTGAMKMDRRFVRFGVPGMADILAFPKHWVDQFHGHGHWEFDLACWIECKAPKGKQSELQKSFQAQVEMEGHRYLIARSIDDVEKLLGAPRT